MCMCAGQPLSGHSGAGAQRKGVRCFRGHKLPAEPETLPNGMP